MADKKEQKLTPEDFEDLAIRIAAVAENYRRVAEAMRTRDIDELSVFGIDTLEAVTLSRINGPLASANRALLAAKKTANRKSSYQVAEDPEKSAIAKQAEKANQIAASRKKKKDQ
jgi:hypothetical protein